MFYPLSISYMQKKNVIIWNIPFLNRGVSLFLIIFKNSKKWNLGLFYSCIVPIPAKLEYWSLLGTMPHPRWLIKCIQNDGDFYTLNNSQPFITLTFNISQIHLCQTNGNIVVFSLYYSLFLQWIIMILIAKCMQYIIKV